MKKIMTLVLALLLTMGLAACGAAETSEQTTAPAAKELNMASVYEKLTSAATLPEMLQLQDDMMLDYCGIDPAKTKQAVVQICADSLRTDEIWLLEATDEAAAKELANAANERLRKKGEESITYSPEQYAVVEKAKLIQTGNYVALIVSPDVDALVAAFNREAGM